MRRWHVEHRDGREWTNDELWSLFIPVANGYVPADRFATDEDGNPMLCNVGISVWCHAEDASDGDARADMVVVFDE